MSGFDEILQWALDNIPPEDFDTFQDWIDVISSDFESNNRLPLEEIFDDNDFEQLESIWDAREFTPEFTQTDIQDFIDNEGFTPEQKVEIGFRSLFA